MKDSASVVTKVAELGISGEAYNIGSGVALAMRELLDITMSLSLRKDIKLGFDDTRKRLYDEKLLIADNTKVRALTGWSPNPNVTETIKDILSYWRRRVKLLYPDDRE